MPLIKSFNTTTTYSFKTGELSSKYLAGVMKTGFYQSIKWNGGICELVMTQAGVDYFTNNSSSVTSKWTQTEIKQ